MKPTLGTWIKVGFPCLGYCLYVNTKYVRTSFLSCLKKTCLFWTCLFQTRIFLMKNLPNALDYLLIENPTQKSIFYKKRSFKLHEICRNLPSCKFRATMVSYLPFL